MSIKTRAFRPASQISAARLAARVRAILNDRKELSDGPYAVTDLIVDLLHYVDKYPDQMDGHTFDDCLTAARLHYIEELRPKA